MLSIKEISIIDDDIGLISFDKLHLSIQVSLDRISYAIMHKDFKKYMLLESYYLDVSSGTNEVLDENNCRYNIENIYRREPILRQNFSSCSLSYINRDFFIFPSEYFDISKKNHYLSMFTESEDYKKYSVGNIEEIGVKTLYKTYSSIDNFFLNIYGNNLDILHSSDIFIKKIFFDKEKQGIFININSKNIMEIVIKRYNNTIEFYNSYCFHTDEEAFYIIYSLMISFDINFGTKIFLYGNVHKDIYLCQLLLDNFKNIIFPTSDKEYLYSMQFNDLPNYKFYTLFGQFS